MYVKKIFWNIAAFSFLVVVAGVALFITEREVEANPTFSIETEWSDTSPLGEGGGYAVPASGGSDTNNYTLNCKTNRTVRIGFTYPTTLVINGRVYGTSKVFVVADYNDPNRKRFSYQAVINGRVQPWKTAFLAECAKPSSLASVDLEVRPKGGTYANRAIIRPGQEAQVRWTSDGVNRCGGRGFATGGRTKANNVDVIEPTVQQGSRYYDITCNYRRIGPKGTYVTGTVDDRVLVIIRSQPAAVLEVRKPGGQWQDGTLVIRQGEEAQLRWSSNSETTRCTATEGAGFQTGNQTSGVDTTITEPAIGETEVFRVSCTDGVKTETDAVQVRVVSQPAAVLEVRKPGGQWQDGTLVIRQGEEAQLRWSSNSETTRCTATEGAGFQTGNQTSGVDTTITEPAIGETEVFRVSCTDGVKTETDAVWVRVVAADEEIDEDISEEFDVPTLVANPVIIRLGDESTLTWNTSSNVPAECSLVGPGVSLSSLSEVEGDTQVAPGGGSVTYTLTCPGGEAQATVQVLPVIQET